MIDIIIFLFCILLIFSVLQIHSKLKNIIFISFGVVLICLAGFRGSGIDRDYISYKWAFLDNDDPFYQINEPSFRFISFIVKEYFNSNILFLFLLYAVIAITLKFYAIKQLSEYWFISLFIYFCYSFTLHDMTQIRVGVAIGFVLLSIKPIYDRNFKLALLFILFAFLFHYSCAILFLLPSLNSKSINKKVWFALIPISYGINLSGIDINNIFTLFSFDYIISKLNSYQDEFTSVPVNIFNGWLLFRVVLSYLFLYNIDKIYKKNKYSIIMVKMFIISVCIIPILANTPVFAFRISDLFSIVDIVLLPSLLYIFRFRALAILMILLFGFANFFLNIFYIGIIN